MALHKVHVSDRMTGKLEHITCISTNPLTNRFCMLMHASKDKSIICTRCYSIHMLKTFRQNAVCSLQKNNNALGNFLLKDEEIPVTNNRRFVRFNAHGELVNCMHLLNLFAICNKNPGSMFALWTKRKDIVGKVLKTSIKPFNLILVYSNPVVDTITKVPEGFDKVFNVVDKKFSSLVNCEGKCIECFKCYTKNDLLGDSDVIVEQVKFYGTEPK